MEYKKIVDLSKQENYYDLVVYTYIDVLESDTLTSDTVRNRVIGMVDSLFYLNLIDSNTRSFILSEALKRLEDKEGF
jgi:hypothetical protein